MQAKIVVTVHLLNFLILTNLCRLVQLGKSEAEIQAKRDAPEWALNEIADLTTDIMSVMKHLSKQLAATKDQEGAVLSRGLAKARQEVQKVLPLVRDLAELMEISELRDLADALEGMKPVKTRAELYIVRVLIGRVVFEASRTY